jgi:MOSC domain-containing protein YiiM
MSSSPRELALAELEAGLDRIRASPRDAGTIEMIVRRPRSGEREVLTSARLDPSAGLVGDRWGGVTPPHGAQLTLMNARAIALVAQERARWPLAGDQLYVDLDLSAANVPPGTRLALGDAVIEVSPEPHTPCRKFRTRYGVDAFRFVGSDVGRELQLRGINTWIVTAGDVRVGEAIRKLAPSV